MNAPSSSRLALISMVGALPGSIIVSGGAWQVLTGEPSPWESLLHVTTGSLILHPILVLGGLILAITINTAVIFHISSRLHEGSLTTILTLQWKPINLAALSASAFLLATLVSYAFVENFRIVQR